MRHEFTADSKMASSSVPADAGAAIATAAAIGTLTVDLDAMVANWRKLEKTAVPAECAGWSTPAPTAVEPDPWCAR